MDAITEKMKKAAALMKAVMAIIAAVMRALFGGSWGELKDTVSRHAKAAKEMVGFTKDGAAAVGRGTGHVLSGPLRALDLTANAVGQTLGAMLPHAPVTAKAVADQAVADDDIPVMPEVLAGLGKRMPMHLVPLMGTKIQLAAQAANQGNDYIANFHIKDTPPAIVAWFEGLDDAQLAIIERAGVGALERHVNAKTAAERVPELPPVAPIAGLMSDAEMKRALADARRRMAAEPAEVAAMAKRGPRPEPRCEPAPAPRRAPRSYPPRPSFQ